MSKPRVITNCVANAYTSDGERIIEFSDGGTPAGSGQLTGGLISFHRTSDGRLLIGIYACSGPIDVTIQEKIPVWVRGKKIAGRARR